MKKLSILAASSALFFVACSGDETTNITEVTESTGMDIIAKGQKMPACDKENAGKMIFVTDSSAVYYCANEKWATLNGKDGANGEDGETVNGKDGKDGKDFVAEYDTVTTEFLNQEMLEAGDYGYFTDIRDNKVYRTVKIGQQEWMAQNLDYAPAGVTSYCYDNDPENCKKYGRLYYWAQANGLDDSYNEKRASKETAPADSIIRYPNQGICPSGWHVPDSTEWRTLETYVKGENVTNFASEAVGTSLKTTKGWTAKEGIAVGTNRYGFSGVAAGSLYQGGFHDQLRYGGWWNSSESSVSNAIRRGLGFDGESLSIFVGSKLYARSVRCLKD